MERTNEELKNVYKKISTVLKRLGISPNREGYWLLRDSIIICLEKEIYDIKITKDIYEFLSLKYQKKSSAIEKAIRSSIEKGWTNCDLDFANELFESILPYEKDRPTNYEFISIVSEHIYYDI